MKLKSIEIGLGEDRVWFYWLDRKWSNLGLVVILLLK